MRCKICNKKITLKEWLDSVHKVFEKGSCEKCESKITKEWVKQQIKLIKSGERLPPKIC